MFKTTVIYNILYKQTAKKKGVVNTTPFPSLFITNCRRTNSYTVAAPYKKMCGAYLSAP